MPVMSFSEAIDVAIADAMADDDRIVVIGEDVHLLRAPLYARFGAQRVLSTPISEAAFVGAAAGAAMAGLRPVVEVMLVDFITVAMDAVLNQMAKIPAFSGGDWNCPLAIRAACGGGYGDGGQHEQCLWGMLAGIPGLSVLVPSTPQDGYALMRTALADLGPVVFLEHKLLSEKWLDFLGLGGRQNVRVDVPPRGTRGPVERGGPRVPLGEAVVRRAGRDLTIVSVGVGVHRALEAAELLGEAGIDCEVVDLRSVKPLDSGLIIGSVRRTGRLLVVDEDYRDFGLSGELAARTLEAELAPSFGRVCVENTLPYSRALEHKALPSPERIAAAARALIAAPSHGA